MEIPNKTSSRDPNIKAPGSILTPRIKPLFGVAILLIVLGLGNVTFASLKISYYEKLITDTDEKITQSKQQIRDGEHGEPSAVDKTSIELASQDNLSGSSVKEPKIPTPNLDKKVQHMEKLISRLAFYRLTMLGGKCFLALAGCILLYSLVVIQTTTELDDGLK